MCVFCERRHQQLMWQAAVDVALLTETHRDSYNTQGDAALAQLPQRGFYPLLHLEASHASIRRSAEMTDSAYFSTPVDHPRRKRQNRAVLFAGDSFRPVSARGWRSVVKENVVRVVFLSTFRCQVCRTFEPFQHLQVSVRWIFLTNFRFLPPGY